MNEFTAQGYAHLQAEQGVLVVQVVDRRDVHHVDRGVVRQASIGAVGGVDAVQRGELLCAGGGTRGAAG
jgi:hypothetical protein